MFSFKFYILNVILLLSILSFLISFQSNEENFKTLFQNQTIAIPVGAHQSRSLHHNQDSSSIVASSDTSITESSSDTPIVRAPSNTPIPRASDAPIANPAAIELRQPQDHEQKMHIAEQRHLERQTQFQKERELDLLVSERLQAQQRQLEQQQQHREQLQLLQQRAQSPGSRSSSRTRAHKQMAPRPPQEHPSFEVLNEMFKNEVNPVSDFKAIDAIEGIEKKKPYLKPFIYSLPRSGSSFTGNLFKSSSDSVFLFEAFAHFDVQDGCGETPESLDVKHVSELMREVYTCRFEKMTMAQKVDWWISRHSTRDLASTCTPPSSPTELPSKMVVLKDIKSFWAYNIPYLKESLGEGLRFIWLVRDVRGWVSSWLKNDLAWGHISSNMYFSWKQHIKDFYRTYYLSCVNSGNKLGIPEDIMQLMEKYKPYLEDTDLPAHMRMAALWTIETLVHRFMLNKYLPDQHYLLKYEDISRQPMKYTEEMFSFIGLDEVPAATRQFVAETTGGTEDDIADRYGVKRNSSKMSDIWAQRLTLCDIRQIEVIAKPAFDFFGYKIHESTQVVDCNLDLFSPEFLAKSRPKW